MIKENDYVEISKLCWYFARKYGKSYEEIEELFAEAMSAALGSSGRFDSNLGQELPKYLFKRIKGSIESFLKKEKTVEMTKLSEDIIEDEDVVEKIENKIFVQELLSKLDDREREIIYRYFWEGKTLEEIAEEENMSLSAVETLKLNTLKKLRRLAEDV
jgi:DNA-directed RNA polymerase